MIRTAAQIRAARDFWPVPTPSRCGHPVLPIGTLLRVEARCCWRLHQASTLSALPLRGSRASVGGAPPSAARWQLDPGSCPLQTLLQAEAPLTRRELVALWSLRRHAWRPCAPKRMAGETERRSYARSSRQSSAIFGGSTCAWRSSLLRRRSSPARTTEGHSLVQVAVVTPRRGGSDVRVSWLRLGGSACPCFRPGHYGSPGRQRRRQANGPISVRCGANGARRRHSSLSQDRTCAVSH